MDDKYKYYPSGTQFVRIKATGETAEAFESFLGCISVYVGNDRFPSYFSMDEVEFLTDNVTFKTNLLMSETAKTYRPASIEFAFALDGSPLPEDFGEFKSPEEAGKFISSNLVALNHAITVNRHMDNFEKTEIRKEYQMVLEDKVPIFQREMFKAANELQEAKEKHKKAVEKLDAAVNEAQELAQKVKAGMVEMQLDDLFTYRVPYNNRYYFYTYIDKHLRLCAIREITGEERDELYNAMNQNAVFIDDNFGPKLSGTK